MYLTREEYELKHFGKKGMKWGVRKSEPTVSTTKRSSSTPTHGVSKSQANSALKTGASIAGSTLKVSGKIAVAALAAMPLALGAALWKEWGYTPLDLIQNRPFLEDV